MADTYSPHPFDREFELPPEVETIRDEVLGRRPYREPSSPIPTVGSQLEDDEEVEEHVSLLTKTRFISISSPALAHRKPTIKAATTYRDVTSSTAFVAHLFLASLASTIVFDSFHGKSVYPFELPVLLAVGCLVSFAPGLWVRRSLPRAASSNVMSKQKQQCTYTLLLCRQRSCGRPHGSAWTTLPSNSPSPSPCSRSAPCSPALPPSTRSPGAVPAVARSCGARAPHLSHSVDSRRRDPHLTRAHHVRAARHCRERKNRLPLRALRNIPSSEHHRLHSPPPPLLEMHSPRRNWQIMYKYPALWVVAGLVCVVFCVFTWLWGEVMARARFHSSSSTAVAVLLLLHYCWTAEVCLRVAPARIPACHEGSAGPAAGRVERSVRGGGSLSRECDTVALFPRAPVHGGAVNGRGGPSPASGRASSPPRVDRRIARASGCPLPGCVAQHITWHTCSVRVARTCPPRSKCTQNSPQVARSLARLAAVTHHQHLL
jgi:hypothetical protein